MKRKTLVAILAAVMAMSAFTGCGSGNKDKANTTAGDSAVTAGDTTDGDATAEITISASFENLTEGEPEVTDVTIETDKIVIGQYKGVEIEKVETVAVTEEDIDELVRTRIMVLRAANKLSDDVDMSVVEEESYEYYRRALETGEHIAYLVYDNGTFIGVGGVSFYQVMPTYHNSTGKKAYIMNMYTAPEYRRQGIAFHTLDLLVKDARKQGVLQIALEATDMGRPLYERYGFVKMEDEMELV